VVRLFSGNELVSEAYEKVASSGSGMKQTSQLSRSSSSSNSKEVSFYLFHSYQRFNFLILALWQAFKGPSVSKMKGLKLIKSGEFEFRNDTLDSYEDCKIMAKGSYETFGHHFALKYNNHNSHKINEKDQEVFTQYNYKCCSHLNCNYEVIEMALYYTQCNYELQYMLL
jgi:hypothetical protein